MIENRFPNLKIANLRLPDIRTPAELDGAFLTRPSVPPPHSIVTQALPLLLFGDHSIAGNLELLRARQVDVIVNLVSSSIGNKFSSEFTYENYRIEDKANVSMEQTFEHILDQINFHIKAGRRVFVHCRKGISRAPSIVIGYLIKYEQTSFEKAFTQLRTINDRIDPNLGFLIQLHSLEKTYL